MAAVGLGVLTADTTPQAGAAAAPGDGSSRSQAAAVTRGAGLTLASRVSFLGIGLLDTVTAPFLNQVATPIVNGLAALPNAVTAGLADGLVGAGLVANSGDTQQPRPSDGTYPRCDERGWDASTCYGPVTPDVTVPGSTLPAGAVPSVTVSSGTVQGYATADADGFVGAARTARPTTTILGFPLGDLGVATSTASCKQTAASCTATQTLTGASLAAGGVSLSLASGGLLQATTGGMSVGSSAVPVAVPNFPGTTVALNGNLATITANLTVTQLLAALGLPSLLTSFTGGLVTDDGSAIKLVMKVGPGAVSQSSPVSAWGLDVSVDITVALKLRVAGLVSASITSTSTPPSLVGLKLAYSSATAGNPLPGWIAPAVI